MVAQSSSGCHARFNGNAESGKAWQFILSVSKDCTLQLKQKAGLCNAGAVSDTTMLGKEQTMTKLKLAI